MRTLLELEENEEERPRRQVQGWSEATAGISTSATRPRTAGIGVLKRLDTASGDIETPDA